MDVRVGLVVVQHQHAAMAGELSLRKLALRALVERKGPASGVAGGRGVDLARREQRTALQGTRGQFGSGLLHAQREGKEDRKPRPWVRARDS